MNEEWVKWLIWIMCWYIVVESVVSLLWSKNDKSWYAQVVRISRIACGVALWRLLG